MPIAQLCCSRTGECKTARLPVLGTLCRAFLGENEVTIYKELNGITVSIDEHGGNGRTENLDVE